MYADLNNWLCHPDNAADECSLNQDVSHVAADGSISVETHQPTSDPAVDCLYIYPTVSADMTVNSDLLPGGEEIFAVTNQVARLNSVCRVYAPLYRQVSINGLFEGGADRELAYADVLEAYDVYMEHHNDGRGVFLIGHSQGALHLTRLIQERVETTASEHERMIAAYLFGSAVVVPNGSDVGETFVNTPLCLDASQIGCTVSYASYRTTEPPSPGLFGNSGSADTEVGCVNPAALVGDPSDLRHYFPLEVEGFFQSYVAASGPFADAAMNDSITTQFYSMPGMLAGQCVSEGGAQYLSVSIAADPADPRADDINGDLLPDWGLHIIDVNLTMGDLVELATMQAQAWLEK